MKDEAIRVRFLKATEAEPARYRADDHNGNRATVKVENVEGRFDRDRAVRALCKKMRWSGTLIHGQFGRTEYYLWGDSLANEYLTLKV